MLGGPNLDMFLVNVFVIWVLLRLGKALVPLNSSFLVPAASEFTMASALLSYACCPALLLPIISVTSMMLMVTAYKSRSLSVLYLKVVAYTVALLSISFISYSYYEMVQSLVTGFISVTPELLYSTLLLLVLIVVYAMFQDRVLYSIFDPEYSETRGLNPRLWIPLTYLSAIISGVTLTFAYGFLLAHVVALSVMAMGYEARTLKQELTLLAAISLPSFVLTLNFPLTYSFSVSSLGVLLLWKGGKKALSKVRQTSL